MGYRNAKEILPADVIELIQRYIDGENIYIPKKSGTRKAWGTKTSIRKELVERNNMIYQDYQKGIKTAKLAKQYYLSEKSIQRIVREEKQRGGRNIYDNKSVSQ